MKYILSILLLLPFSLFAPSKATPQRNKGEVFKHTPTTPYEDLSKSGVIVVRQGMYGLTFEDDRLPQEAKDKVIAFFVQRNRGYTDLKTYTIHVENRKGVWWIEGRKID